MLTGRAPRRAHGGRWGHSPTARGARGISARLLAGMEPIEDGPCAISVLLSERNGADICAALQARVTALMALRPRVRAWRIGGRDRYRGSLPGRRPNKARDFDSWSTTTSVILLGSTARAPLTMSKTLRNVFAWSTPCFSVSTWRSRTRPSLCGVSTRQATRRRTRYNEWSLPYASSRMGRRRTALTRTCEFPLNHFPVGPVPDAVYRAILRVYLPTAA